MNIYYRSILSLFLFCAAVFISCKQEPTLVPLDLMSHGLPIKILAPEKVTIVPSDFGIMKDCIVTDSAGFILQIFESQVTELNTKTAIENIKSDQQTKDTFSKMIQEDPHGFIFERKIGEDYINYDFRHIRIAGDRQYLFQAGIARQFTLDQVKLMYKAVQNQ